MKQTPMPAVRSAGQEAELRPVYQHLADDLVARLAHASPPQPVPSDAELTRIYNVPLFTAQFIRRAAITRLRPPRKVPRAEPPSQRTEGVWWRIADDLREQIVSGRLRGQLPNRPRLAATYRVSTSTLTKAIQELVREGLVTVHGSQGTHISEDLARHTDEDLARHTDGTAGEQVCDGGDHRCGPPGVEAVS